MAPTFWSLVEQRAAATPDAVALIDESRREMTFGEYRDAAVRAAAGLAELGIGPGTRVAWQLPTWIESIVLTAALARLGAVQIPIIPIYRRTEVGFCLRQAAADWFVVPGEWRGFDYRAMADDLAAELGGVTILEAAPDLPQGDPAVLPPPPESADEIRWIYYTSGTTSDPKGAKHSDASLIAGGEGLVGAQGFTPDDVYGVAFPFTHVGGAVNIVSILTAGFRLVIMEAFEPAAAVDLFGSLGATIAGGGPAFIQMYLEQQRTRPDRPILPELRFMTSGGAPVPPEMHEAVKREIGGVGVTPGYGMTECPMISMPHPDDPDEKLALTEGRPVPGCHVRIVAEDGTEAAVGQVGEVRVAGAMVCAGYVDSSLDAAAFDDQGALRTGDLGFLDADGFVTLTGRLKDIIIRKGENISAGEIEDVLYAHPKVGEVAVVGLPDISRGELVCAVVTATDPADPLTFDEMVQWCRDAEIMTQKIPERLELVDALPRNATGKVLKHELTAAYDAA